MDLAIRLCLMFASKFLHDSIRSLCSLNRGAPSITSPRICGTTTTSSRGSSSSSSGASSMAGEDILEEQGDLFSAPPTTSLAHCVSSDLKMGAGIAVLFRRKFGRVEYLKNQEKSVGEVAYLRDGPRFIFYLITKQWFYDKPTLTTLLRSLLEMRDLCDRFGVRKLAMPRIGCGLDGLQWPIVYEMITEVFSHRGMEVTIYTLPDRISLTPKSFTPNLLRTQEKIRNSFEPRRPFSLPARFMASKRKMDSYPSDDEYDTPKKRLKKGSDGDGMYHTDDSLSQPSTKRVHPDHEDEHTNDEDYHGAQHSNVRREKKTTNSPWSKPFSNSQEYKKEFWSTPQRKRDSIPFLDTEEERYTCYAKKSSHQISDSDEKEKSSSEEEHSSEEEKYSKQRHRSKRQMSHLQGFSDFDGDSEKEVKLKDSNRRKEPKSRDSSESKEKKSRASSRSKERKDKDSSKSKERKNKDSSRSKERKIRDSSSSKERKSRDSSRSKERKSRDSSRSKERKNRDSSKSKEMKNRDSSRSKERKSGGSSRSRERKSVDSDKNKGKKSRKSSTSRERKYKESRERRAQKSCDSSESESEEYGYSNKTPFKNCQPSDQSDDESIPTKTGKKYHRCEESSSEGSKKISLRKILTRTQRGRQSSSETEYSESREEKKVVKKYPALNISLLKSVLKGGMYSDKQKSDGNVKNRLSLNVKPN
ncbi:ADP-ribose glycohydrolase OARD1 [Frankliniella fusca]|uniref:ADP-ribose glycohydrolase OARD1 n=1 Tax=Frankliniella fusca TaxID=407009 RepID=A0AAE1LA31_9NEOP|nr:ADP-ribose glycohydrolase OARD1 [Frankliniella fusca]